MSKRHFLDFEQPVAELESKIEELRYVQNESAVDISEEIDRLGKKSQQLTKDIYAELTPWQVTQIARHPQRPYTLDYVSEIFTDFQELHGDRAFADDQSIVGGLARFNGQACMVHRPPEGPRHQGARAAQLRHAAARGLSQGAAPDEARREVRPAGLHLRRHAGRLSRASAPRSAASRKRSAATSSRWRSSRCRSSPPIIGEGGSGGALAIGVGDQVLMLQYSIYSVISPEGCASILWKTAERAAEAADALGITAHRLKALGLVDKIVNEPVGGAHRDPKQMAAFLKRALNDALRQVARPDDARAARAPLRAAPVLRPLQRHDGALRRGSR